VPIEEYLRGQGRFRHLVGNEAAVERVRTSVEARWQSILARTRSAS
jgi:pyruvate/2-oxoacid:ferredoxin oxidoreductase beta subunit